MRGIFKVLFVFVADVHFEMDIVLFLLRGEHAVGAVGPVFLFQSHFITYDCQTKRSKNDLEKKKHAFIYSKVDYCSLFMCRP